MEIIKSSTEISELFSNGKRFHSSSITFMVKEKLDRNTAGETLQHDLTGRVAFIAGKKHGNAVWRNKAKRRMRAVCRELGGPWRGYDVIFLAKPSIGRKTHFQILNECSSIVSKFTSSPDKLDVR